MRDEAGSGPIGAQELARAGGEASVLNHDRCAYIYIGAVHQGDPSEKPEGFELITRYPAAVNEFSAQSVYKDGVLFVIASPKESSVVEVPVLSVRAAAARIAIYGSSETSLLSQSFVRSRTL